MKTWMISLLILALASVAFAEPTAEERVNALQQKILEQQQVLQNLEQQLQSREDSTRTYTEELVKEYLHQPWAEDSQGVTAGYNKGFFIQSGDGDYKLLVNGYIRGHLFIYEANTVTDNSFRTTEARLDFHMYLLNDWHIRVRPDFTDTSTTLREAYIEYLGYECLKPRIGGWITPFSLEYETNPPDLLAIGYSPYLSSVPHREVGFGVYGNGLPFINSESLVDHFSYFLGVFNGQGLDRADADDGKMFMANAKFYPLGRKDAQVYLQASFMYNDQEFREDGAAIRLWGLRNRKVFGNPATFEDNDDISGHITGYSVAGRYWKDNFRFEAEAIWMHYERRFEPDGSLSEGVSDFNMFGVSAGASYFIEIGKPESNMGFEPLAKFSYTDIDDEHGNGTASVDRGPSVGPLGTAGDVLGQNVWEIVVGAKFHVNKHVHFDFNWVMYDLAETSDGLTNNATGEGGGLIHAFLFQWVAQW